MPWNNPDNNGKKNNEGPPDLDEAFKEIFKKIKGLFGLKFAGPNIPFGDGDKTKVFALAILALAFILYLAAGFYTVSAYEQAIVTRFGKYARIEQSGLHWRPRFIERVQKINTETIKSTKRSGWMLTKDENIVLVEVEVQFRVLDAEKYLFNVDSPDFVLEEAADSALRQVVGDSLTDDVLTDKKQQIAQSIKEQLESILNSYNIGFYIEAVNFRNSRPPEQVKDAFDDVTKSREDRERLKLQAEAYANTVIPEAEGNARKILAEAEAYKESVSLEAQGKALRFEQILPGYQKAPIVTKKRMYFDSMQEVLSKTTKVVTSPNGNNNLIYLPLDKMLKQQEAN